MIKLFCSPPAKLLFSLAGFIGFASILRAVSHTFHIVFGRVFGEWFRFDIWTSAILFALCMGLLALAVWMTKPAKMKAPALLFLRKADFFLLALFSLWLQMFLLFRVVAFWEGFSPFFLLSLVYALFVLVLTELAARLRDRELSRTLYWIQFFRVYPVWRLLGFVYALLLLGNLFFLVLWTPPFRNLDMFGIWPDFGLSLSNPIDGRWRIDLANFLAVFSGLSLSALTYFATHLLGLSKKYNAANEEKIRAERFKSELITNVSHDIRTPLTSIINYVDLLKSEPLAGRPAAYIRVLEKKSARLKALIGDLMDASKAGTGNVSLSLERVNLTELTGQVAGEFEEQFTQRGLILVLREPETPVFVHTDSRHLWRSLENLFSNAAKYALAGTRVFAEILEGEAKTVFTLKNTSQTPIDLSGDALTEQFIRGDMARESEGSGLGLYIAKSLVELTGGQFEIRISGDLFVVEIVFEKA